MLGAKDILWNTDEQKAEGLHMVSDSYSHCMDSFRKEEVAPAQLFQMQYGHQF